MNSGFLTKPGRKDARQKAQITEWQYLSRILLTRGMIFKSIFTTCRDCFSKFNAIYTLTWITFGVTLAGFLFFSNRLIDTIGAEILVGCSVFLIFSHQRFKNTNGWTFRHWLIAFVAPGLLVSMLILVVGFVWSQFNRVEIVIIGNGDGQYGQSVQSRSQVFAFIESEVSNVKRNVKLRLDGDYQDLNKKKESEPDSSGGPDTSVNVDTVYSRWISNISETKPHILELDVIWISDLVDKGILSPMDDVKTHESDYYTFGVTNQIGLHNANDLREIKFPGKREYARPFFLNVGLLMYDSRRILDVDIDPSFESVPEDWDELFRRILILREYDPSIKGFVFQGKNYEGFLCSFIEMLWAHGGSIVIDSRKGIPQINNPRSQIFETLQWYQNAIRLGVIPPEVFKGGKVGEGLTETTSQDLFFEGNTLVHRNWPRTLDRIHSRPENGEMRTRVRVFPRPIGRRHVDPGIPKAALGGWAYAITPFAEEQGRAVEAMRVIEAYTSKRWFDAMVRSQQLTPEDDV